MGQLAIERATVEAIDLQPAPQVHELFVVIVNCIMAIVMLIASVIVEAVGVGVREERREQLQQPFGDANDGVMLAKFQKGPRSAAVFWRRCASATDTYWVTESRLKWQDLLDPDLVPPAVDEVVFIQEALADAQPQINESYAARIASSVRPVHPSLDDEAMQVLVAPCKRGL